MTAEEKPRGRLAVRRAIVRSAAESSLDAGSISVRDVARRAGVNHGQVQHLFAGKDGLYRAVLEHLATGLDEALPDAEGEELAASALTATLSDRRFVRFLASYLVEHPEGEIPQESFPVVHRLERALNEEGVPRSRLAALVAAGLGWAFFEPWIRAALELGEDETEEVGEVLLQMRKNR